MGYAGGTSPQPTYMKMGDHTETIRVEYDPSVISYRELLEVFLSSHDPEWSSPARQYRSVVLYLDDGQRAQAESALREMARRSGGRLSTKVEPLGTFHPAEDYHQKYYLRSIFPLITEFKAIYPDEEAFVRSTAAARVNGYVGGNGSLASLDSEGRDLGLSRSALEILRSYVSMYSGR